MSKYFSKALCYDEIRKCAGTFGLVSVILIIKLIDFIKNQSRGIDSAREFEEAVVFATFFMVCGIIANLYESYNHKDCKYGFMLTQPYKRDAIVITKFLTTILSVIIPLLIYGIIVSIIYIITPEVGSFKDLWVNILLSISIGSLVAAIIQLFNKLIGNSGFAILMPIILCAILPMLIVSIIVLTPISLYAENIAMILDPVVISIGEALRSNVILFPIILIGISGVTLYLSILLNRRIDYEKTSDLFLFKFVDTFFGYLVSLFITIGLVALSIWIIMEMFAIGISRPNLFVLIAIDIVIIILTIVIKKSIYYFKRRRV